MKVEHVGAKVAAIAVFVGISVAIFLTLYSMAGGRFGVSDPYTVSVTVPEAGQLVPNADVRVAGVKVGRVAEITSQGSDADLRLELDGDVAPIHRDATVRVRMKTLVGENYIELDPGHPRAGNLERGAHLDVEHAKESVQLDQILSALDAPTRQAIRRDLRSLGAGFAGRGADVNAAFEGLEATTVDGRRVAGVLDEQRDDVAAVLEQAGAFLQAFADRSSQVRALVTDARSTARSVAARDAALRAALSELPSTLSVARTSVDRVARLASRATPVVRDLRLAARDLTPTVRDLRPAASATRRAVRQLHPALRAADPMLARLRSFTTQLPPLVRSLDAVLRQADPAISYLKPFYREFGAFFADAGAGVLSKDALGNLGRVHLIFSESSAVIWTPELKRMYQALLDTSGISKFHAEGLNFYPRPGTVGRPEPADGRYPQVAALPPGR